MWGSMQMQGVGGATSDPIAPSGSSCQRAGVLVSGLFDSRRKCFLSLAW